jgi:ADP-ribosylglycohydrolase
MPGRPSSAAELAFRDARISHVKNGIYGEMMASAMIAAAFCLRDPEKIVQAGLSVIPAKSRLSEAVRNLLEWSRAADSWQDCWSIVKQNYGHYSPVHTINNALNVILALIYGELDFTRTIGIAVMGGWDTDCNGATAGSIVGAAIGASRIPEVWKEPLHDKVESHVRGYQECRLSDLASRATRQAVRNIAGP